MGAVMSFELVWPLADIMNGLMALPNLIGIIGLTSIITIETRSFFDFLEREKRALSKPKKFELVYISPLR